MGERKFIKITLITIITQMLLLTFTSVGRTVFTKDVFATEVDVNENSVADKSPNGDNHIAYWTTLTNKSEGNNTSQPFHIIIPKNLKQNEKVPLVIYFHGDGTRQQLAEGIYTYFNNELNNPLPSKIINYVKSEENDKSNKNPYLYGKFIYVAPGFSNLSTNWTKFVEDLYNYSTVDGMKLSEHIDTHRIIVMGHSTGGCEAWEVALEHHKKKSTIGDKNGRFFAGVIVCSAPTNFSDNKDIKEKQIEGLQDFPLWLIGGVGNYQIEDTRTNSMIRTKKSLGKNCIMTKLTKTYNLDRELRYIFGGPQVRRVGRLYSC